MTTIKERFEALRIEAAAELARLEREAQEARDVLAALGGKPPVVVAEAQPTEAQVDAAREYSAEGAHAVGKRAYHGRVMDARSRVLAVVGAVPKTIKEIAVAVYGGASSHDVDKAARIAGHMAKDGQVKMANGRVWRSA